MKGSRSPSLGGLVGVGVWVGASDSSDSGELVATALGDLVSSGPTTLGAFVSSEVGGLTTFGLSDSVVGDLVSSTLGDVPASVSLVGEVEELGDLVPSTAGGISVEGARDSPTGEGVTTGAKVFVFAVVEPVEGITVGKIVTGANVGVSATVTTVGRSVSMAGTSAVGLSVGLEVTGFSVGLFDGSSVGRFVDSSVTFSVGEGVGFLVVGD